MNLKEIIIKPDEKYVELKGVRPNLNQARMLKNLAADNKSETKATFQYLYQHYIIDAFEPEIARILEEISIVEMTHYELLNEAILVLGGNVEVTDGNGTFFSTKFVEYEKNIYKFLQIDINNEYEAAEAYTRTAEATSANGNLSELLLQIADNEITHAKTLENILMHLQEK